MTHKSARILSILGLIVVATAASGQTDERVAYAPDILGVGRLFLIALNVDPGAPRIDITIPDAVELLDQTSLPTDKPLRKYYFRTLKPAEKIDIVFAHPAGPVTISVQIWDYDDLREFRELKGHALPRRWPLGETLPALKQEQTITTELMKARARERGGETRWAEVDDDIIWGMQPDSTIPRWHWVNVNAGCPAHGTEIFKHRAFYPWGKNSTPPWDWKITCPVENEKYPSNDFAAFLASGGRDRSLLTGDYPDDGWGWDPGTGRADAMAWVSYYLHHVTWQSGGGIERLGLRSLLLDDREAAHRAAILLARLAYVYPGLNFRWQQARPGYLNRAGRALIDGNWERNNLLVPALRAYDAIWEYLDEDAALVEFLHARVPPAQAVPDRGQAVQLGFNVATLVIVGNALGLDLQDGDLVQQLADRHRHQDRTHFHLRGDAGAGEGNRTLVLSLGSFCSTIELHPPEAGSLGPRPLFCQACEGGVC